MKFDKNHIANGVAGHFIALIIAAILIVSVDHLSDGEAELFSQIVHLIIESEIEE